MIQGREHSSSNDENDHSDNMTRDQVNRKQMEVFPHNILKRVDINSIQIASRRSFLAMMMLVDVRVQPANMQEIMKPHVKVVIEGIEGNQRAKSVPNRHFLPLPLHRLGAEGDLDDMINKAHRENLVDEDKQLVGGVEVVEVLSFYGNERRVTEKLRHIARQHLHANPDDTGKESKEGESPRGDGIKSKVFLEENHVAPFCLFCEALCGFLSTTDDK